jgi:hypothetical protein
MKVCTNDRCNKTSVTYNLRNRRTQAPYYWTGWHHSSRAGWGTPGALPAAARSSLLLPARNFDIFTSRSSISPSVSITNPFGAMRARAPSNSLLSTVHGRGG